MNYNFEKKKYTRSYWGPRLWYIIHKITYSLPQTLNLVEQQLLLLYFTIVGQIIPCPYCASHFKTSMNMKLLNRNLATRQNVIDWFNGQHNDINIMNKRRIYHSYELDPLYSNTSFNHDYFSELLNYLYDRAVYGEINRKSFIHWVLMTYRFFPCEICKIQATHFFLKNDIELSYTILNDTIIRQWIDGLVRSIKHT
jgi:hypothetical protein